jgi:predicted TIM-barrel fold metal-dependent hydrolase
MTLHDVTASSRHTIDAHTHFSPPKFLAHAETIEGKPFVLGALYRSIPTLTDVTERVNLLDRNNIDIHVLVPVPWLEGFPRLAADRRLAAEAARLMNDELAAAIAVAPSRLRGVAILPTVNPDDMVAELHRAVEQLGFVGAYVPVGPTVKRMDHPDYVALYRTIAELDVALWLHPSRPPAIADYVDEQTSQFQDWLLVGWPHDTTTAMLRIVFSGVFERHPDIRIITHHHGGYVPLLASRLDANWGLFEQFHHLPTKISRPYIDHFKKFYCDTATSGFAPKVIELAVDFFCPDHVLFGTDAPFDVMGGDVFTKETLRSIEAMAIDPETRDAVYSGNARRIIRFA